MSTAPPKVVISATSGELVSRDKPEKQRVTLKEGYVITVMMPDRFSDNHFWLSAVSTNGEFF